MDRFSADSQKHPHRRRYPLWKMPRKNPPSAENGHVPPILDSQYWGYISKHRRGAQHIGRSD